MVYLDNSATTKPCETAIEYMNRCLTDNWGNPSSLHTVGISAEELLTEARKAVAKQIGAEQNEIFFTSSGTEANNIAIIGACEKLKRRGKKIVTTEIEHPSVKEAVDFLEAQGFTVVRLRPDENGIVSDDDIYNAIDSETILVSIMLVNNEIGSIQPIEVSAKAILKSNSPALLHCDAVQAFGKLPIDVKRLGVDLLTASAHKIHGPKGAGFLYKKRGVNIATTVFGGGQEAGLRSGTQPLPAISGFLGAITELPELNKQLMATKELNDYAREQLLKTGLVTINSCADALPYILNVSVNGYKSETILHFLDSNDIYVSSGSACSKGKKSYVLESVGLSQKQIDSSIRLSFNRFNTKEDIDKLCAALVSGCKFLRKAY